jgi:hypothetical protein
MAKTAAQLTREINEALNRRVGSGELPPYEGMAVTVTKYGALHHGLRSGAPGIIKRVASPDARHGTPSARARVLVEVDGSEVSTDWPTAAFHLKGAKGATARRSHSTKQTGVSIGDEVYAVSGGRRHGPGIVEHIYNDGTMTVDFTRQYAGRRRVWPEELMAVPKSEQSEQSSSHATKKSATHDWTARQMTSGRRVVEKTRGDKTARIFQGEGHWTVTVNRTPREPFETTGEITRQSAKTLAAAKSLGTRLLKAR